MPRLRPIPEQPAEPPKVPEPVTTAATEEPDLPEVIVEEAPREDNKAALALKKQIDDLRKSEEVQRNLAEQLRREREQVMRQAAEQASRATKAQRETLEQEDLALDSTRSAAKAAAEKALSDYKNALDAGDNAAAADAMDRLTDAKADLRVVERGREELKLKKKELKKERRRLEEQQEAAQRQPPPSGDPVDGFNLPPAESDWLKGHREYYEIPEKYLELDYANKRARLQGLEPGHPGYLPFIKKALFPSGEQVTTVPEHDQETQQRASMMSAPVSREAPTSGGQRQSATRVTLTREEKEFAKISGVSEADYAKQKIKLAEMKSQGIYGESR